METYYRIYTAPLDSVERPVNYKFIAEFADGYDAGNYAKYMRGKKRYSQLNIIMKSVAADEKEHAAEKTEMVIGLMSEHLPLDKNGNVDWDNV